MRSTQQINKKKKKIRFIKMKSFKSTKPSQNGSDQSKKSKDAKEEEILLQSMHLMPKCAHFSQMKSRKLSQQQQQTKEMDNNNKASSSSINNATVVKESVSFSSSKWPPFAELKRSNLLKISHFCHHSFYCDSRCSRITAHQQSSSSTSFGSSKQWLWELKLLLHFAFPKWM